MAFNPFEAFSIRSKLGRTVMAILGIVVMFTFVLSTGMGGKSDFFEQVGTIFDSKGKGEVLATVYGDDIKENEFTETRRQRLAANTYLAQAIDASYTSWARELERDLQGTRLSADTKRDIERFVSLRVNAEKDPRAYGTFLMDFQRFGPEAQRLGQAMTRGRLKPDSEDKKALDAVAAIILHDMGQTPFVLVELGDTDKDLMDFILLQKKADQLGIKYTHDAVEAMVQGDTAGRFNDDEKKKILRKMTDSKRHGEFTPDWLMTAVGNEYRARTTLAAFQGRSPVSAEIRERRKSGLPALVLGLDTGALPLPGALPTASAVPGGLTPYEFWEFYKDRCSEHSYAVLELKAEDYLDKVTEKPTEKELKDLYNKYRGDLYDPGRDRPGFKEPRKVKVSFVAIDATAARVADALPKVKAASLFLNASWGAMSGSPAGALSSTSAPALSETLPLKQAVAEKMEENLSRYKAIEQYVFEPRDISIYRPQPIAALLGGFAGYPSLTGAVAPYAMMFRHVEQHDIQTRVPILLQAWLTPFSPTMGNALGMPAFAYALNPKVPLEGFYLADAVKEQKKRQRQLLFEADVRQLETKLFELTRDASPFLGKADKAKIDKSREEARKHLEAWLKDRNLTPTSTKGFVDERSVSADPELKPLNALATPELDGTNSLSKKIFEATDPRMFGGSGPPIPRTQPFQADWFPAQPAGDAADKPNHLVWVTEDVESKTFNNLANADANIGGGEMTKRVEYAWKLEKARALAKADADKLANEVRAITKDAAGNLLGVERQLRDLAAQRKAKLIHIDDLAVLKFKAEATQAKTGYEKPKLEKHQVLYPTENFVDQLLELRKQPLGAVAVLPDAPRTRYFVAAEVERNERTIDQFRMVFGRSTETGVSQDPLYMQHALPEERGVAIEDVRARLRADAKYDEKDAFKKREKKDRDSE